MGVRDARVIVDGDVQVLSAGDAATQETAAIMTMVENREFLDVEVDHVARRGMLVTNQRRSRFEIAEAADVQATQDATDGGTA